MNILTDFQESILQVLGRTEFSNSLYFTGGSALAEYYLQHRYSEDLDVFTSESEVIPALKSRLPALGAENNWELEISRSFHSFMECYITGQNKETVKLDFGLDSPFRLEPTLIPQGLNLPVDSALDIACNKLSALYDRVDAKDFVDVYFIHNEMMQLRELIPQSQKKHVGIEPYWLASAFAQIEKVEKLPRMIKPVTVEELRTFFIEQMNLLMAS